MNMSMLCQQPSHTFVDSVSDCMIALGPVKLVFRSFCVKSRVTLHANKSKFFQT